MKSSKRGGREGAAGLRRRNQGARPVPTSRPTLGPVGGGCFALCPGIPELRADAQKIQRRLLND